MMQRSSSFPLITKPRLSNPVGLGEGLARCQSTLARIDQRGPAHNHKQVLCHNETERLSISPACRTQRINCANVNIKRVNYDQRQNDDEKLLKRL